MTFECSFILVTFVNRFYVTKHLLNLIMHKIFYCTLRGRDQRLKCAIIFIFYGAVLYLPNFRKIQHTWANIARLAKTCFHRYFAYPAIKQRTNL